MFKKKKKRHFFFPSLSLSLSSLLGCDVIIVQYFLFRYILRLECCLPLKAGCTLEDFLFFFWNFQHLAEVQMMPRLSILDSQYFSSQTIYRK